MSRFSQADIAQAFNQEFDSHVDVAAHTRNAVAEPFVASAGICLRALEAGHKLLLFGNGGSAADAQHLATEFVVRFRKNRPAMAAIALTTDTSALTAIGNDFGFEQIFSRQIEAIGQAGDVAIGISTSGNSPNVLAGFVAARKAGMATIGFTGGTGGKFREHADVAIVVPSDATARIQEMHILLGHALCDAIERAYGYYP